jgi:hypothetical protein
MLVQITVKIDGGEVGTVERELSGSATEMEEALREVEQRSGRMVMERALQQVARQVRVPRCCGKSMKNCGRRVITVSTTFGDVPVERTRYRCRVCGDERYPADAEFCCGRHRITKPLAKRVCQLATREHFPRLAGLIQDQHGLALGRERLWELTQDVGTHAERLRQAEAGRCRVGCKLAVTPVVTPRRLYVTLDGILYPTNRAEPDPNDPTHQKTKYEQMKVGAVYWQDEKERWHKRMTWGRESPAEFAAALYRLACRHGYEQAEEKVFAADGADWCWEGLSTFFSAATGVLDWYHASEHVWDAARAICPAEPKSWAGSALDQMHDGGGAALLSWLREQQVAPTDDKARAALDQLIGYVAERVDRMDYPAYRAGGWQIGTGLIESTCKQLVGLRLKGPGMHWSEHGALAMTALKATDINGDWHSFWNSLTLCA